MKLKTISAIISVSLISSMYSMEERADGRITPNYAAAGIGSLEESDSRLVIIREDIDGNDSRFFDASHPDIDLMNPQFLGDSPDDSPDYSDTPSPESPDLSRDEGRYSDKIRPSQDKMMEETWLNLLSYNSDKTYKKIPAQERPDFMRKEWALNSDPTSFYRKYEIYNIKSAKKRYDLIKEHEAIRKKAALKGIAGAVLSGVGALGIYFGVQAALQGSFSNSMESSNIFSSNISHSPFENTYKIIEELGMSKSERNSLLFIISLLEK